MKDIVIGALRKIVKEDYLNLIEIPADSRMGDYAFPCFTLAKEMRKAPDRIAVEIAQQVDKKGFERVESRGAYVNFFVDKKKLASQVLTDSLKKDYGKGKSKGTIVLDYSHPNVAKHFGVHNLRSTLIGHAIYNILSYSGKKVVSVNHLGDWGTQFGKLIVAYKKFGKKGVKDIAGLNSLYVKFHDEVDRDVSLEEEARAEFKKLESGDKENLKLWKSFLDISLKEFNATYKLLGIKFDQVKGESYYRGENKKIIELLEKKKLLVESEGARVVEFDDIAPCIIAKSDEASTYATRDVAAILERMKMNPESIVYVVDIRQSLHFEQVFRVAEKLGIERDKLYHAKFGLMRFPDEDMSTRKGKVILFGSLLAEAENKLLKIIDEKNPALKNKKDVARKIAIASIVFHDLQNNRVHDVVFDWGKALNFEGKAAPYILYTYARAKSIEKKAKKTGKVEIENVSETEFNLVKKINQFPEVVNSAAVNYEPHIIAEYSYQLAQIFNEFYHSSQVIGSENESFRLKLVEAFAKTLDKSLELLGITALNEM